MKGHTDSITDFYNGRHIFCTGASGMLGTAFVFKLLRNTSVACVYALVRGGARLVRNSSVVNNAADSRISRLWSVWDRSLPPELVKSLHEDERLQIIDGDIILPDCGMTEEQCQKIYGTVSVFVHGASTINLQKPLVEVAQIIVHPSLNVAKLALKCPKLERFVYISSAYASTFLKETPDGHVSGFDSTVPEEVNRIGDDELRSAALELSEIDTVGSTPEFEDVRHPYAYTYAKHLTERLLLQIFHELGRAKHLLIVRPSCIGPAVANPFPFYEIPGSSPGTSLLAAFIATPPMKVLFSSHLADPASATVDEIPVDCVVNHILAHVAFGTSGCVHAVAGAEGRHSVTTLWNEALKLRRSWWGRPTLIWRNTHWKSEELSTLARLFVVCGCSFLFKNDKSINLWQAMNARERHAWPLWQTNSVGVAELLAGRKDSARAMVSRIIARQYGVPGLFSSLLCA